MKLYKSIEWAYPTSPRASELGHAETGCWFVNHRLEGSGQDNKAPFPNAEGFPVLHPDLIALYHEADGEPCPYFLHHGHPDVLKLI